MTSRAETIGHINAAACKLERMIALHRTPAETQDVHPAVLEAQRCVIVEYGTLVEEEAVQARMWPLAERLRVMMDDFMGDAEGRTVEPHEPDRRYGYLIHRRIGFWPVLVAGWALEGLGVVSSGTAVRWAGKRVQVDEL